MPGQPPQPLPQPQQQPQHQPRRQQLLQGIGLGVCGGLLAWLLLLPLVQRLARPAPLAHVQAAALQTVPNAVSAAPPARSAATPESAPPLQQREFALGQGQPVSPDLRRLVAWVLQSADNGAANFVVVDKKMARLYVFDANARLLAHTPVLLGWARGDSSVPGIAQRPMAQVLPHERTTPAGRFMAVAGHNAAGEDVVWVDHAAAVSMHRLRTNAAHEAKERRVARLASTSAADNRISYGCINVPASFFDAHVRPRFLQQRAPVYVLPEQKRLQQVFPALQHWPANMPNPA